MWKTRSKPKRPKTKKETEDWNMRKVSYYVGQGWDLKKKCRVIWSSIFGFCFPDTRFLNYITRRCASAYYLWKILCLKFSPWFFNRMWYIQTWKIHKQIMFCLSWNGEMFIFGMYANWLLSSGLIDSRQN